MKSQLERRNFGRHFCVFFGKTTLYGFAVLMQYRWTDRQTDRQTQGHSIYRSGKPSRGQKPYLKVTRGLLIGCGVIYSIGDISLRKKYKNKNWLQFLFVL